MEKELEFLEFLDLVMLRYKDEDDKYERIYNFVLYLDYTEALNDVDNEFKSLFEDKYLNSIVEGEKSTFTHLYKLLKKGFDVKYEENKKYSGLSIIENNKINYSFLKQYNGVLEQKSYSRIGGRPMASCLGVKSADSCGFDSSSSRCGSSSSSSSCGSSRRSSSYSRCGGSSSSSCGSSSSYSRC